MITMRKTERMTVVMEDNKALSSLSYLSVCFAPVLLPFMFFSFFTSAMAFDEFPVLMIVLFILHGITSLIVFIWNIVKGIKVLAN